MAEKGKVARLAMVEKKGAAARYIEEGKV